MPSLRPLSTYTLSGLRRPSTAHTSTPAEPLPSTSDPFTSPNNPISPKYKLFPSTSKKNKPSPPTIPFGSTPPHPPENNASSTTTDPTKTKKGKIFTQTRKNTPGWFLRLLLRTIQFILGLTVIGIFGTRIHHDSSIHQNQASQWIFALLVGAIACLTVLFYMIPFTQHFPGSVAIHDEFITLLYLIAFGVFAALFEGRDDSSKEEIRGQVLSTKEYRHAVWLLLVNVFLWLVSGLLSAFSWWIGRNGGFVGKASAGEDQGVAMV